MTATSDKNTVLLSDSPRGLRAAVAMLRAGECVALPTETVYGLGADATNPDAVAGIFRAKGRPSHNPLILHVADLDTARQIARFDDISLKLANRFWPGPLTLVLPRKPRNGIAEAVTADLPTIALRVPAHSLALRLLDSFGGPLAAPSANPSGRVSPTSAAHVMEGLRGRIAGILDGGDCPVGVESTIVGMSTNGPVLLRPGGIPVEDFANAVSVELTPLDPDTITAPGQMASHYAPQTQLRLNAKGPEADEVWLGFGSLESLRPGLNLSPSGDLAEAASALFAALREMDVLAQSHGAARIAVAPIPETGLGRAINDRLRRAAAPRD